MIHDVFFRRYPDPLIHSGQLPEEVGRLFMQVAQIVFEDLGPALSLDQAFFKNVHNALAREMGVARLADASRHDAMCGQFLVERYDLWIDRHGMPDTFMKERLSLIELLFREAGKRCEPPDGSDGVLNQWRQRYDDRSKGWASYEAAVVELNSRFLQARMPFHYHNGMIQFAQDRPTEQRIAEPCWSILADTRLANAELDMKEAFDRADAGKADAAFYAAKALESVIKIISDEKGWTHGRETGAAGYIDNLLSQKNGRFIEPWEADILKLFFKHVRNPHGHGAGSQPPSILTTNQTGWAIETTMSWIKNLIRRL